MMFPTYPYLKFYFAQAVLEELFSALLADGEDPKADIKTLDALKQKAFPFIGSKFIERMAYPFEPTLL
jgi:hypothetical protein